MSTTIAVKPRTARLTVREVIEETTDAISLILDVPAALRETFTYRPGQFLVVRVPSTETGSVARCYSLSSAPVNNEPLRITIKRTTGGYGSNWLCDNIKNGDALEVLPPGGIFTPKDLDSDLLLLAGGSGITPIMSILRSCLAQGTGQIVLFYANRDDSSVIFAREIAELSQRHPARLVVLHWLESLNGLPASESMAALLNRIGANEAFICGPAPFMASAREALESLGVPRHWVHVESYVSLSGNPFEDDEVIEAVGPDEVDCAELSVTLEGETTTMPWPRGRTLVDTMLAAGMEAPYSCREGECGSCACIVVSGKVEMTNHGALDEDDIAAGYVLGCQTMPVSEQVTVEF